MVANLFVVVLIYIHIHYITSKIQAFECEITSQEITK